MIQDDDEIVAGKISEHTDRLHKEIAERLDILKPLYIRRMCRHRVDECVIAYINMDVEEEPEHHVDYVTIAIPKDFQFNMKKSYHVNHKEFTKRLYMLILKQIVRDYPIDEHDLHSCSIHKIELLDD